MEKMMDKMTEKIIDLQQRKACTQFEIITDGRGALTAEQLEAYRIYTTADESALSQDRRDILFVGDAKSPASAALSAQYPGSTILHIDLASGTPGRDFLILMLSRLRAAGATIREAAAYFERHKPELAQRYNAPGIVVPLWSPEHLQPYSHAVNV